MFSGCTLSFFCENLEAKPPVDLVPGMYYAFGEPDEPDTRPGMKQQPPDEQPEADEYGFEDFQTFNVQYRKQGEKE